jgi:hypothetical protein
MLKVIQKAGENKRNSRLKKRATKPHLGRPIKLVVLRPGRHDAALLLCQRPIKRLLEVLQSGNHFLWEQLAKSDQPGESQLRLARLEALNCLGNGLAAPQDGDELAELLLGLVLRGNLINDSTN